MSDGSAPGLEVGFAIDTSGSFAELIQLQSAMNSTEAKIVAEAANIERATGGMMNLGGPTASMTSFGNAATRELQNVSREKARTEKAGEALIRVLDREAAAFGKTRDQMRDAKGEAIALAAAQQGNTDLADRLIAASRRRQFAAEAVAETEQRAAAQAAVATEAQAQAVREAAYAYQMFEARVREGAAALREQEVAQKAINQAAAAARARVDAEAAVNAQLLERSRIESALERNTGVGRVRATDAGAGFSALAAKAVDDEARATASAAAAVKLHADAHERLAAMVRGSQAAQEADAVAAERLRMSTDPLYAATSRLNVEIAESTRLYHSGATAPAEYARQQDVLTGRLREVERQHTAVNSGLGTVGTSGKLAGHHVQNLAFQFQDLGVQMVAAAGSSAPFKMGMMALMQQGAQIQGIMNQAGIGIRGVGAAFVGMSKSILLATLTNPYLLAAAAAITVVAGSIKLLQNAANQGADMKAYAASLGLTAKEIRHLDNVTVTYGDTAKAVFQVAGAAIWSSIGPSVTATWEVMKQWAAWIGTGIKAAANFMIGAFVSGYNIITKTWRMFPAVMGELFYAAVNASIGAINSLVGKSVEGLNGLIAAANTVLSKAGLELPTIKAPKIGKIDGGTTGEARKLGETIRAEVGKGMGVDYVGNMASAVGGAVVSQAIKNAHARLKKQAEDKGYLDPEKEKKPKKPTVDHHAEQLAREAEAVEAQIKNLYALADAYGVSGAAALIAEARVKAESDAIKKRADIEELVARQVRLAIAQRVSDAAKGTAAMREQADAQAAVNALVVAGTIPAERAADLVKEQIADLPLLAAIQAAQQLGLATEAARATQALADQRAERLRLTKAESDAKANAAISSGNDRLAELREELRLVGATEEARARGLAVLKAQQEVETWTDPAKAAEYVKLQGDIAAQTVTNAQAQTAYNDALTFTADKWDIIAGKVQAAGSAMADAFGSAGRAIGDLASIYASYEASRERAVVEHAAAIKKAGGNEKLLAQENARFALRSSGSQIAAYGDMVSAAKGFFHEGSAGYKAMAAAEKVYRVAQLAMSLQAMVQSVIETTTHVAGAAAQSTADGTAGVAAQSKLPFPFNIVAMAATAAALIAAGVSVFGGGGGGHAPPVTNTGTGTVLGDSEAKSESIKRAIDALQQVDVLMLSSSRQMAQSLKSIDSHIGGLATLVVRAGNVDGSTGVASGFKANAVGSVLGAIPIIGGMLKGLFGTSTKVIGGGLYGGAQSLGSILDGGFDAKTYSDVEKKKKFFGITTSTKNSTQYGAADGALGAQFTLLLRQFNDAIVAAAGPLGGATGDIQNRLNGFVVNIGKIDLKDLTGAQIQEKLSAVFGAAADNMADAAFPGIQRFQKVGEGAFETLVRVSSTVEAVTNALSELGATTAALGIDAKVGLAGQFDSVSGFASAVDAYFQGFYTKEEQAAAKATQFGRVFESLGLTVPSTLAGFRALVEAQDLTTAAGQATYATLLQLAPAFADLKSSMDGAKSASDILSEQQDLQRRLLELNGDTAAIRALDLAKIDASNRALQEQVWAVQDAQEAAKAADELRKAWVGVGDTIMDEVKRIRGLSDVGGNGSFASLMGRFNTATDAARAGDIDAAKALPGLSQALLSAAALVATSRQELDRVQAQTAASLEATNAALGAMKTAPAVPVPTVFIAPPVVVAPAAPALLPAAPVSTASILAAVASSQAATAPPASVANDDLVDEVKALREEVVLLRADTTSGHVAIAANTGKTARVLEGVTSASGGESFAMVRAL